MDTQIETRTASTAVGIALLITAVQKLYHSFVHSGEWGWWGILGEWYSGTRSSRSAWTRNRFPLPSRNEYADRTTSVGRLEGEGEDWPRVVICRGYRRNAVANTSCPYKWLSGKLKGPFSFVLVLRLVIFLLVLLSFVPIFVLLR